MRVMRGAVLTVLALAMSAAAGCAHKKPAVVAPAPAPRVKLAVLPVESDAFPAVADAVNASMRGARVSGVDDYFLSKVTLDVVQLSIECVDPTTTCWAAVGKSLSANKLLLAQVRGGVKKRDRSVHVTVTLFDVDAGVPMNIADQVFKTRDEAVSGVAALVDQAVAGATTAAAAGPAS
jgi:hypothetical protein